MNRRSRLRFRTDISVTVTLFEQPGVSFKGRLKNLSAHGLSVILSEELPPNSCARIEWGDASFDGRWIYCERQRSEFLVGFEVAGHVYDARQKTLIEENDLLDPH